MGTVLEMIRFTARIVLAIAVSASLAACGNDPNSGASDVELGAALKATFARIKNGPPVTGPVTAPDAATIAAGREVLQAAGQPIYMVNDPGTSVTAFMAPLGENGGVITWANSDYLTVGLRDGVVVATRGFGADMMSANAPTAAQLSNGAGTYQRQFYYLDGADQTQIYSYTCNLSVNGADTITVLGKSHKTRKISETCEGKQGSFVNQFWFENGHYLRQSSQLRVQGVGNLLLQRIID